MWIKLFTNSKNTERDGYVWNMLSSITYALQAILLLVAVGRICGTADAGLFSIAYAIANLLYFAGTMYGRRFQVSDIREEYLFNDYLAARMATCTLMITSAVVVCICGIIFSGYDGIKCVIIMLLCGVKCVDAFAEVFYGRFQQQFRLDISARINVFRFGGSMVVYICALAITRQFLFSTIIFLAISVLLFLISSVLIGKDYFGTKVGFRPEKVKGILKQCFPLFVAAFLLMYITNAPKYVIDAKMTYTDQAVFNYIFMPVFAIRLLADFIFNPIMAKLSLDWDQKNYAQFRHKVSRQLKIIVILSLGGIVVAYFIGTQILSWLFGYDLAVQKIQLTVLIVGGGFYAVINFLGIVTTIMRIQWRISIAYIITSMLTLLLGNFAIEQFGLFGASFQFLATMIVLTAIMAVMTVIAMPKLRTSSTESSDAID